MIGAVVMILLVWGPQKVPELARSLGEAKHELEKATKGGHEDRKRQEPS